MANTILTSRAFEKDIENAKKAAAEGPVFITDRGRPTHVLLCVAEYQRLTEQEPSIVEALGWPAGIEDVEIAVPRSRDLPNAADLS